MEESKVKESPSEVYATVADVNSAFHSLEDVLGVRFEAVEEKITAMGEKIATLDARNDSRFEAVEEKITAMGEKIATLDARNDRRFEAVVEKIATLDAKFEGRFMALKKDMVVWVTGNEGRFDLLEEKISSQDLKIAQSVTSAANKLMIMMLVIAGSIIASLLYAG